MPPKLKLAAATPPKKNPAKKEPRVKSITSALSENLRVAAPAFKYYSMVTLDGYMVKPYCKNSTDYVEVDIHVAGVLKENSYNL